MRPCLLVSDRLGKPLVLPTTVGRGVPNSALIARRQVPICLRRLGRAQKAARPGLTWIRMIALWPRLGQIGVQTPRTLKRSMKQ